MLKGMIIYNQKEGSQTKKNYRRKWLIRQAKEAAGRREVALNIKYEWRNETMAKTTIDIPENETKEERFIRIATPRVNGVIQKLEILSNCSGATYGYTEEQVDAMFDAIELAVANARKQFQPKTSKEKNQFSF